MSTFSFEAVAEAEEGRCIEAADIADAATEIEDTDDEAMILVEATPWVELAGTRPGR